MNDAPPAIHIVYTANTLGLDASWVHINEPNPLYDAKTRGNIRPGGFVIGHGVASSGHLHLGGVGADLTVTSARAAFAGNGVRLLDAGKAVPGLTSDYAVLLERPTDDPPWIVDWLAAKLREKNMLPDAHVTKGRLYAAAGADGQKLWLYADDGKPPAPAALRDYRGWRFPLSGTLPVQRGDEGKRELVIVGRPLGGRRVHQEAARRRAASNALRVDAGNMVGEGGEGDRAQAFEDLLAAIPGMRLDALVPGERELRLLPVDQRRLAKVAPLVAANLIPPPDIAVKPFVLRERAGRRIAVIGLADEAHLARYGLVGGTTGWQVRPPVAALQVAVADARQSGADAIVVVTNIAASRLYESVLDAAEDVQVVITPFRGPEERDYHETFVPTNPHLARFHLPWRIVGSGRGDVGQLTLKFGPKTRRAVGLANAVTRYFDDQGSSEGSEAYWSRLAKVAHHNQTARELVLPDKRLVAEIEPRIAKGLPDGEPSSAQYLGADYSRMAASGLRRTARAEVGLVHTKRSGSTTIGDVPRDFVEAWFPTDRTAVVELTGEQIQQLSALDGEKGALTWAGYDPASAAIGGRPLVPTEVYRVATTQPVAMSEDLRKVLEGVSLQSMAVDGTPRAVPFGATLREVVMDRLIARRKAEGGFTPAFQSAVAADILDDGKAYEPRWRLDVRPVETSFQQFQVRNRAPFGAVRNAQINAPDSSIMGGKGDVSLTYEGKQIDWENRGVLAYQRADFQVPDAGEPQEQADQVRYTSEIRLKSLELRTADSAIALVPFLSGNYLTEFTPTVDPTTLLVNPRRRELNGIAGVVLRPGTWVQELRVGAIAKNDLAVDRGGFEPGVQVAAILERPLGPFTLALQADVKNYFLTPDDTADDLGLLGTFGMAVRVPIWGALGLSVGMDTFVFSGKVPATRELGLSWTPTIGFTYRAAWKPQAGVLFGLPATP